METPAATVILVTLADPPRATEITVALNAAGELHAKLVIAPALSIPSLGGLSVTARLALCFLTLHDVCGSGGPTEVFVSDDAALASSAASLEGLVRLRNPVAVLVSLADLAWASGASPERRNAVDELLIALAEGGAQMVDTSIPCDPPLPLPCSWPSSAEPPTPLSTVLDRLRGGDGEGHVLRVFASDSAETCAERMAAAAAGAHEPRVPGDARGAAVVDAGLPLLLGRSALQCLERYGMYGLGGGDDSGGGPTSAAAPSLVRAARAKYCWWRDPPAGRLDAACLPPAPVELELATGVVGAAAAAAAAAAAPSAAPVDASSSTSSCSSEARPPPYRVAILGGSFNPITLAHTQIVAEVLAARAADEVWLVPCGTRPDKPSLDTPGGHRTAMAALAVEASFPASAPAFVVPLERWEAAAVPSYVLMARLASLAAAAGGGGGGGASFSLIIGADLVPTLPAWRHATRLLAEVPFLCVPRPGYAPPLAQAANEGAPSQPQQPRRLVTVSRADGAPLASMQLSSTAVRRILRVLVAHATGGQGGAWRAAGLVAPQVLAYAVGTGCYGGSGAGGGGGVPPLPDSLPHLAKSRSEMYAEPLPPSPAAAAAAAERVHSLRAAVVSAGHFAPSAPPVGMTV